LKKDFLKIAGKSLKSRLIVGTGKYKSFSETAKAVKASGADMVTVAVRRVNILDKKTLYPNMLETINSTKILVKEGFKVMVYCTDDPLLAKKLEDSGAAAIMPLASPIGSGLGIQNKVNISLIIKQSKVPVIVDAGIGTASDATIAMELGCDGVLINSAIANAKRPILMAKAFKDAVISGRNSYLAGRMKKNFFASPSSPTKGLI